MPLLEILLIALGLAMDAFAVSVAAGAAGWARSARARFRLWFHFGLFQALMPVIGWLAGVRLATLLAAWDHWIAFGLLVVIGGRMVRSGLTADDEPAGAGADPTRGRLLMGLAVATSIDALAVGFSFACLELSVWLPALIIGVVASILSLAGCLLGARIGDRAGGKLEVLGGLVLILVGLKIVVEPLLG